MSYLKRLGRAYGKGFLAILRFYSSIFISLDCDEDGTGERPAFTGHFCPGFIEIRAHLSHLVVFHAFLRLYQLQRVPEVSRWLILDPSSILTNGEVCSSSYGAFDFLALSETFP